MAKVDELIELFERLQSDAITVRQHRCVVIRNRNAQCFRCAEACTSKCIDLVDGELVIDTENCVGCGTCATACPTCALEIHSPNDADLLRSCLAVANENDGEVVIGCSVMLAAADGLYIPEKAAKVTCMGRVEESLLLLLASAGVESISLVHGNCMACRANPGINMASLVADTTNTLLEVWDSPLRVSIKDKLPMSIAANTEEFDASRRGFFVDAAKATRSAIGESATVIFNPLGSKPKPTTKEYLKVNKAGSLPKVVPGRRGRLLSALDALGSPKDEMINTRLWGHVIINQDKCSSCTMCATFCPTGALKKVVLEDGVALDFTMADCAKCRSCESICAEGAISLSQEVFAADFVNRAVERNLLKPRVKPDPGPHQIWHTVRDMIPCDQVYER